MKITSHKTFVKAYARLSILQKKQIDAALRLFGTNRTDPFLQDHALKGKMKSLRAFSAGHDLRVLRRKKDPNIDLVQQNGLNVGCIAFNVEKKPFDNKRVRKALNMAINKKGILEAVFEGAGQAAKNPTPPTQWGYNDKVTDYADIASYGIMRTPGLVVDDEVILSGRVPTAAQVKELLAPLVS